MKINWQRWKAFALIAAVVTLLDQLSKWLAVEKLTLAFTGNTGFTDQVGRFLFLRHPSRASAVTIIPDFWRFIYVENPGAAWGFLSGSASSLRTPFFLMVSLFAMGFILTYFPRTAPAQRLTRFALALVFGGAIGNFLDRVRLGYVIDFIEWHWYDKAAWPTFNVADSAITVGVILLLIDSFMHPENSSHPKTAV